MYFLGVDIGSYSSKGALLSATGELVATATRPHQMRVPAPGLAEHDADADWWGGFQSVTRQLLDRSGIAPEAIAAVGCSGIGPCMLPVDADGRAITEPFTWRVLSRWRSPRTGADYPSRVSNASAANAITFADATMSSMPTHSSTLCARSSTPGP